MSYREELVALITNGTAPGDIYNHFRLERHLGRSAIMDLLHDAGVDMRLPPSDDAVSDERRRYLQELSLS